MMLYRWQDGAMHPLERHRKACVERFDEGSVYNLDVVEPRSAKSHAHFFACVTEAWQTMPEDIAARFPSPDHLRKFALIKSGHCDQRTTVLTSKAEALRVAAFIRPLDEYAIVVAEAATVSVYTAHSQAVRAMGAKRFQQSKDDVLHVIAELTGTDASEYGRAA